MEAELYKWGIPKNSTVSVREKVKLETHFCTAEELGLENPDKSKFYPVQDEDYLVDVKRILGNWHCFNDTELQKINLFGDYHSLNATVIKIHVKGCDEEVNECDDYL